MDQYTRFLAHELGPALGIPLGTLAGWGARGFLANFDAGATVQGRARYFTVSDGLALALLREALPDAPVELINFAPRAAKYWLLRPGTVRELHFLRCGVGEEASAVIRYNDDVMKDAGPSDWRRRHSYNLDVIFGAARTALEKIVAARPHVSQRHLDDGDLLESYVVGADR